MLNDMKKFNPMCSGKPEKSLVKYWVLGKSDQELNDLSYYVAVEMGVLNFTHRLGWVDGQEKGLGLEWSSIVISTKRGLKGRFSKCSEATSWFQTTDRREKEKSTFVMEKWSLFVFVGIIMSFMNSFETWPPLLSHRKSWNGIFSRLRSCDLWKQIISHSTTLLWAEEIYFGLFSLLKF